MSKRLFNSLAVGILFSLALAVLVWAITTGSQNKPPTVLDAKVKPVVPVGIWADVVPFPIVNLGFDGGPEPTTGPLMLRRAAAVSYPPNGKVYILGGRHRPDGADIGSRWIWEYNPSNNTLTQKNALLDGPHNGDKYVANMAIGVLTDTNGPRIYIVGGSNINGISSSAVRVYDPTTDTLTSSDNWPANPARIPGGYAVFNNKLYIFGGHQVAPTTHLYSDTWVFDPMMPTGQRWSQIATANLSVPRAYIAGAQLDGYIYAIGGDQVISNTATPLSVVERMDPSQGSPTWQPVASLPWAKGDIGAWAYGTGSGYEISGRIVIAGGGYPVPDTAAFIYNPSSNSWSVFPDMLRPRRNYAAAQLNGMLYAWGGYDVQGNVYNGSNSSMAYNASGPPPPPGITPTNTPSPLPTTCASTSNLTYTVSTGATIDPGTSLVPGTTCQTCVVNLTLPFPVQLYDRTFTTAVVGSTGNMQLGSDSSFWINRPLPWDPYRYTLFPLWDDLTLTGSGHGIYTSIVGNAPSRIFNVEWRGTGHDFEVRLFEDSSNIEFVYGTGSGGTATIGVQKDKTFYTQIGYNVAQPVAGTKYTWLGIVCGPPTPTVTGTPPSATRTPTPTSTVPATNTRTATATVCSNYNISTSTGATIVPGTTFLPGSNCDDCVNAITLPFPFRLYDQTFTTVNASSNGNLQFLSSVTDFTNICLPIPQFNYAILPQWDDLLLTGTNQGIYYSTSGSAPNRIFNIEWIGAYFSGGGLIDMEVRLYENSSTQQIDFIYGTTSNGSSGTVGIQKDTGSLYAQFECGTGGLSAGLKITFTLPPCSTGTPVATATATSTPTFTPTHTPTLGSTPTCGVSPSGPWTTASPVPQAQVRYGFAQVGNDFYVVSGVPAIGQVTNAVYKYNTVTGAWTTLAPIPTGLESPATAYYNGKLYAAGGDDGTNLHADLQIYNIATNTWSSGANMPIALYGAAAGAYDGKVFVAGGESLSGGANLQIYDIATNSWSLGTDLPDEHYLSGFTQVGQYLYLVGSYGDTPSGAPALPASLLRAGRNVNVQAPSANSTVSMRLDMSSTPGTWSIGPVWTMQRTDFALASDGAKLYAIGGDINGGTFFDPSAEVDELTIDTWPAGTWIASLPNLPSPRQANSAGFYGNGAIWSTAALRAGFVFAPDHVYRPLPISSCPSPTVPPTALPHTPTATSTLTATPTSPNSATDTPTNTPTNTPQLLTATPTATPTVCTIEFSDVPPGSTFYAYIHCLACHGIVNGYADGTFRPNNDVTRGQLSKLVSNSAGFNDPPGARLFEDVAPGSTFYDFIQRLANRGYITGYACGGPGEPCNPPGDRPYFRPYSNSTRGQLAKIVSNAAGFIDPPVGQTFEDVPPGSVFYTSTERLASRGVMQGYLCGGTGEPCVPPGNRSYFRPFNNATRGQTAKIVANTFMHDCDLPTR